MSRHLHAFGTKPRFEGIEVLGEKDVLHAKYLKMREFLCTYIDLEKIHSGDLFLDDKFPIVRWIPRYERLGFYRDLTLDEFREWYYANRRYLNKKEG